MAVHLVKLATRFSSGSAETSIIVPSGYPQSRKISPSNNASTNISIRQTYPKRNSIYKNEHIYEFIGLGARVIESSDAMEISHYSCEESEI